MEELYSLWFIDGERWARRDLPIDLQAKYGPYRTSDFCPVKFTQDDAIAWLDKLLDAGFTIFTIRSISKPKEPLPWIDAKVQMYKLSKKDSKSRQQHAMKYL